MNKYKETPPVEIVTWLDHFSDHTGERSSAEEIAKGVKADWVHRTVGMLVHEDDDKLVLSFQARIDTDIREAQFSNYTAIYKKMIVERVALFPPLYTTATGRIESP